MKSFRHSITALTVTTAMAIAAVPATAQVAPDAPITEGELPTNLPLGTEYHTQGDITYHWNPVAQLWVYDIADVNVEANAELEAQNADILQAIAADGGEGLVLPQDQDAPTEGEEPVDPDAPAEGEEPVDPDAPAEGEESDNPSSDEGSSDPGTIAGIALPAALIIGGIMWYLNQDGRTYVQDPSSVDREPTAEEQAASDQMLEDNADEVMQQAEAAQGDKAEADAAGSPDAASDGRGMAAETGNNTLPRALVGLVLTSLLGAAAFAARRRFLA